MPKGGKAVSDDQKEFIRDLFGPLGNITLRPMMGGLCIYSDGDIFAILKQKTLNLRHKKPASACG